MRGVMWFSIGFGVGCALWVYGNAVSYGLPWVGGVLCGAMVLAFLGRKFPKIRIPAVLLLGLGVSLLWCGEYHTRYLQPIAELDGQTREAVITAEDYGLEAGYSTGVDGRMVLDGKSYAVRAYLQTEQEIQPGNTVRGNFQFRLTTPEGELGGTSHAGKGTFLLAYQKKGDTEWGAIEPLTFPMKAARLRRQITERLRQCVPEDVYAFAKALLLGDTRGLPYEVDSDLKISGIRHVAAVSGLHVSILFAMLNAVLFRKRFLSSLLGMPVLLLLAALAGFTPSVNRACMMCGLMLLARLLNREYDGATALGFAVLVMLAANPYAIASVSLQLSTASVAGIFLFMGHIQTWLANMVGGVGGKSWKAKCKQWFTSSAATTLGAMALTTPLCAWYFGMVSLVGILTNLLTLWGISFVFYGLMAACAFYGVLPSLGLLLGRMSANLIRYILFVAKYMAKMPISCVYTNSRYIVFWLLFVYVLLGVFLFLEKKRPGQLIVCILLGLCPALWCSWLEPRLYDTSMTMLDVGQGQCILLQSEGKTFLVDCGGDNGETAADLAASQLLSRGISRVDGLILTHMDQDHMGGSTYFLHRVDTELLILPPVWTELEAPHRIFADGTLELSWGKTKMTIYGEKAEKSDNENSLCILLDTEKCDILITGDRGTAGEKRLVAEGIPKVDVLVAGHHGSKTSTTSLLLETVQPEIVCISVGENVYGHPAKETLQRLEEAGCQVYRTDQNGTITIRR